MPRRPDLPCADCGRLMWRGKGVLPAGLARCRECRKSDSKHGATGYKAGCRCAVCREGKRLDQRAYIARAIERNGVSPTQKIRPRSMPAAPCSVCGDLVTGRVRSASPTHAACRPPRHWKNAIQIGRSQRVAIYMRDAWVCGFCCCPVEPLLDPQDLWAATLDHVLPRSKGGSDDPSNLRLVHRWCNSVRGNADALTLGDIAS